MHNHCEIIQIQNFVCPMGLYIIIFLIIEYAKENNYSLVGEIAVLGLIEEEIDIVQNMFDVSKLIEKTYNVHEVKPTYLKD